MIQANELRIDNWVDFPAPSGTTPAQRWYGQVDAKDIALIESQSEEWYRDIRPIPLSPEVLAKAGFINDHSTFEYVDGSSNGKLFISWIDLAYVVEINNGGKNHLVEVKYLHQLQNLFFALTGEELTTTL